MAVAEVVFRHQLNANAVYNVRYFEYDDAIYPTPGALGVTLNSRWGLQIVPKMSQACTYLGCSVKRVLPGPTDAVEVFASIAGGDIFGPLPNQVAMVLSVRTGLPGRARRGRIYIGGMSEGALVGGTWDVTALTDMTASMVTFATLLDGLRMVHVSKGAFAGDPTLWTIDLISTIIGRTVPGVIRRRRIGTGI